MALHCLNLHFDTMFSQYFDRHLNDSVCEKDTVESFESVWISEFEGAGTFEVAVGDFVEVFAPENRGLTRNGHGVWICQICRLFPAPDGTHLFEAHWFNSLYDTIVENTSEEVPGLVDEELPPFDDREVFAIPEEDASAFLKQNNVNSIYRKTNVRMVGSGPPPNDLAENEYFVRFSYSKRFHAFKDLYPLQICSPEQSPKKIYKMLELYSGCGGFSFVGQKLNDYSIQHSYAVDLDADSIKTYKLNHPETRTFTRTVESFLNNCKGLLRLYQQYLPEAIEASDSGESCNSLLENKIFDLTRLDTDDPYIGVRTTNASQQMQYLSIQRALDSGIVSLEDLKAFLWKLRRSKPLPLPQDVDIIIGGPPCQGLSMKNMNNDNNDIFSSSNNIEIKHFLRSVAFFKPRFMVLENISQMFECECGLYIRFLIKHLITLGYQLHCGILSSACYGAPQMRFRCFVIAALSGLETLPPFPHPTFNPIQNTFISRKNSLCSDAKSCIVEVSPMVDRPLMHPTLLWDALEDLPNLDNWSMTESAEYRLPAQRPYQCYLRRNEDKDPEFRAKAERALMELRFDAQSRMDALREVYESHLTNEEDDSDALLRLGEEACVTSQIRDQYWEMHLNSLPGEKRQVMEEARDNVLIKTGKHLKKLVDEFSFQYTGPCLNHRCTTTNKGDELRIKLLPPNGGDFTSLPGVIRTRDYICVGHTHGKSNYRGRSGTLQIRTCCPLHEDSCKTLMLEGNGCKAHTAFTSTGDLAVPRWVVQAWNRKKGPPRNIYGRLETTSVFGTLLTSVKASCGYAVIHPFQNRFLSVREAARIQGFPDDYIFLAGDKGSSKPLCGMESLDSRFKQIGNSVSPPLATMIGKAILYAIMHREEIFPDVVYIENEELDQAIARRTKPCYFIEKKEGSSAESSDVREALEIIDLSSENEEISGQFEQ